MAPIVSPFVAVPQRDLAAFAGRDAEPTVVWLRGEHDLATVAALWETIARAIALCDADLVVDLSGVQFMDASTIGVIIRARDRLRLQSRSLVLRSPSTCARRLLDLCGLAGLLEPRPVDANPPAGPSGALGTWVPMLPTDRVDRPVPAPSNTRAPIGVVRVGAGTNASSVGARDPWDERPASVGVRGGP